MPAAVYLIPSLLAEGALQALPPYLLDAVKDCQVFYVEEERTTRRFFKQLWREMPIDNFEWVNMKDGSPEMLSRFRDHLKRGKHVGIVSEAGCPGIADPGQLLIAVAQQMNVKVKPLVGPSSILLALMASGLNGQHFEFHGYLPIDAAERTRVLKQIESRSRQEQSTQIFIETPYRNNQLFEAILKSCQPSTLLCVAVNLTGSGESVITKPLSSWRQSPPSLHKIPVIFLIQAAD